MSDMAVDLRLAAKLDEPGWRERRSDCVNVMNFAADEIESLREENRRLQHALIDIRSLLAIVRGGLNYEYEQYKSVFKRLRDAHDSHTHVFDEHLQLLEEALSKTQN